MVHNERLDNDNVLQIFAQYDLIVDGTDNFATRYMVNDACVCCSTSRMSGDRSSAEGQALGLPGIRRGRSTATSTPNAAFGHGSVCAEGGVLGVLMRVHPGRSWVPRQ